MPENSVPPEMPPLKLTPFEEFMFFDDRPAHPMTGFFRLRFSGCLDFLALDAAIQTTVRRHPLVRSRVCRDARGRLYWESDETSLVVLERLSADSQGEYPDAGFIDLTLTSGTRIWLVDRKDAHDLVFQIHHACTDALGMCQLIEDLLVSYALHVGAVGRDLELKPLDNQQLPHRNQFGLGYKKLLRMLPGLHVVGKFFLRKAAPLGLPAVNPASDLKTSFPSPCSFEFSIQETQQILARAKLNKVTVNDLLACGLFLAINTWRTNNGVRTTHEWLRFFVPVNERMTRDETLSAANIMSAVFLERNTQQLTDRAALQQSIQDEMQGVKRRQLGLLFIAAQTLLRRFPRLRNRIVGSQMCLSSCVFSNLGIILSRTPLPRQDGKLAIGEVLLDGVDFIAPLRPMTAAAFCIYTYAGRLSVNLHFDPRSIPKGQAEKLLECVIRQIQMPV